MLSRRFRVWILLAVAFAAAIVVFGQVASSGYQVAIWDVAARQYVWPTLGQGLAVREGQLEVLLPPPAPQIERVYDVELQRSGAGWALPADAAAVVVHVNGLRYRRGLDYQIEDGIVTPMATNMVAGMLVTADYDHLMQ